MREHPHRLLSDHPRAGTRTWRWPPWWRCRLCPVWSESPPAPSSASGSPNFGAREALEAVSGMTEMRMTHNWHWTTSHRWSRPGWRWFRSGRGRSKMCLALSCPDSSHRHGTLDTDWRGSCQQSSLKMITNWEFNKKYLIVRHGDKLLAICESPLGLIDPCSGPLLVFVRISRKLWCLIFCLSMLIFDLSSTIKKPEPEPALLLVIWLDCGRHELVVLESALHYFAEDQLLFVSNFQMISFFLKWNHRWLPFRASWNSFQ